MSDVIAKVVSQKGTCEAQHKVGDEFVIGQPLFMGFLLPVPFCPGPAIRRFLPLGTRP